VCISVFVALALVLTIPTASVFATEDISNMNQGNRSAINPEFDPDYSCLFDVFQLKCVPGSEQVCPDGFSAGDPENCFPKDEKWKLGMS
jgi:hypothetical protein